MTAETAHHLIRIASALIENGGRLLLVRKAGTPWFMQAGGKIEPGETPADALRRELKEEIGFEVEAEALRPLGVFSAVAANEAESTVEAALFHLRTDRSPVIAAEIAEAVWVTPEEAADLPLAPLTRLHVLPLAARLEPDRFGPVRPETIALQGSPGKRDGASTTAGSRGAP